MSDNWKYVQAAWHGEMAFIGTNKAGGIVQMGKLEGKPGISPMEMLLLGAAGCTGMDIVSILEKKRQAPEKFEVRVRGKRAEDYPMIFTDIEITYLLWGDTISPKAVEDAIRLSEEKYCSASIMLRATAKISSSYQILAPGETVDEVQEKIIN
jgi:putative redox protein